MRRIAKRPLLPIPDRPARILSREARGDHAGRRLYVGMVQHDDGAIRERWWWHGAGVEWLAEEPDQAYTPAEHQAYSEAPHRDS